MGPGPIWHGAHDTLGPSGHFWQWRPVDQLMNEEKQHHTDNEKDMIKDKKEVQACEVVGAGDPDLYVSLMDGRFPNRTSGSLPISNNSIYTKCLPNTNSPFFIPNLI